VVWSGWGGRGGWRMGGMGVCNKVVLKGCLDSILFSIFTAIMWYLYELSYKGIVFYVGISKKPIDRYKQHCALQHDTTKGVIALIRDTTGDLPSYNIIHGSIDKVLIMGMESDLIFSYAKIKHGLCNIEHNTKDNVLCCTHKIVSKPKGRFKYNQSVINNIQQQLSSYGK
jgi:hypothetical protein